MLEIIIPIYNNTKTLPRTLYSLACQLDTNFKVLIVDDCSEENVLEVVDTFRDKLNIRYIRNENRMGIGMTRQKGIDNAIENYITFLDSDDVFMPYTVGSFNNVLSKNSNLNLIYSYFYEEKNIDNNKFFIMHKEGYSWCHGKVYSINFLNKFKIRNSPEVLINDDVFFNSMCTELSDVLTIPLPTIVWVNNLNSTSKKNGSSTWMERKTSDLINCLMISIDFLLQYKSISEINYLSRNLEYLKNFYKTQLSTLSFEEQERVIDKLKEFEIFLKNHNYNYDFEIN